MRIQLALGVVAAALMLGSPRAARGQTIPAPGGDVVLTDPLVRAIQIGPPPVGAVVAYNPATGIGMVAIPGIGTRAARLAGVPVSWAGRRAIRAVDIETDVEYTALLPTPPQLVPAKVARSIGDSILVRRDCPDARVTEAVPVGSVFAAYRGGLAPATRVLGALQPGATVLVPPDTAQRARVIIRKSGHAAGRTRRRSARTTPRDHRLARS
jgi:hypothetical protein